MTSTCAEIREHLSPYVDGELNPVDRLLVAEHLVWCELCRDALQDMRDLGDLLRTHSAASPEPADLTGLAAGVISRSRAEQSQSWRSMLHRGIEDWHWAMVGAGSLGAAVVSVVIAAAICAFGPRPARDDSLAALINNLEARQGVLWMVATPVGRDQIPMLMQFDGGSGVDESASSVLPDGFAGPNGDALALALAQAVVGPDGRLSDLRSMSRQNRQQTEALLLEIQRLRAVPMASWSGRRVNVQRLVFSTKTYVTGKAL